MRKAESLNEMVIAIPDDVPKSFAEILMETVGQKSYSFLTQTAL